MNGAVRIGRPREAEEIEALRTDRYLDALLAAADRRALDAPASAAIDPEVRRAIRHLRRGLVRVHPSFRFEERLAVRLADAAAALVAQPGRSAHAEKLPANVGWDPAFDPADAADIGLGGRVRRRELLRGRELLIGGAMASAAVSIAGAALVVARRRAHGRQPAMSRAARAVRAGRRDVARRSNRRFEATRRAPLA
ncbi:MAG TPA: hypothetical protein VGK63_01560 [Candidatus Limnocylindrales bacterium]